MKLNRKGFMLAEVTVVATLAATVMMVMYASSIKIINAYKERENYYDVDTIYAAAYAYNYMIDSGLINDFIVVNYNNKIDRFTELDLLSSYNISDIRFIKSNQDDVDKLISEDINRTFKNYLNNYVKKNVSESSDKYMFIVERVVDKEYYYYSVEV